MASSTPDACLDALRRQLGTGSVLTDEAVLREYSTDASPCFVVPRAVVQPTTEPEVVRVLRICSEYAVPVTPRAAGTSLSGAAIGPGVVLDTSRLDTIEELDPSRMSVRLGPGVRVADLNDFLAEHGLRLPLEPGSRERCRIGGMVGHNASGYQSVKYGQMRDYVIGLRVVLSDGTLLEAHDLPLDGVAWNDLASRVRALEEVRRTLEAHRTAILASRRPVKKLACGYDLARLVAGLDRGVFPLAQLFLGSEGTLGIVTEATLRVVPRPPRTVTLLMFLEAFEDLASLVGALLPLGPSALEGIDGDSLTVLGRKAHGVPPSAQAMLLAEFDEGDLDGLIAGVMRDLAPRFRLSRAPEAAFDPDRQATLWQARRSLFPTLIRRPGSRRPLGFVEDPIVPTERVPEFIRFLSDLTRKHGTVAGIYGHLGDGNIHYRPLFDPTDPDDFARMQALRAEFDEAVLGRFHGAPSAEDGVGRLRADVLPRVWGAEVYEAMRSVKEALDPRGLLNPGVLFSESPWWESWGGLESRAPM